MAKLRLPVFVLALIIVLVLVALERSAVDARWVESYIPAFFRGAEPAGISAATLSVFTPEQQRTINELRQEKASELSSLESSVEGFGVPALQFVDVFLLYTLALMALGILWADSFHGRVQGCISCVVSFFIILAALAYLLQALAKLILMVALLLSFPFGTIIYLVRFGSFPTGSAGAFLSLIFILKIIFVIVLLIAHQKFIENKLLVVFIIVSFVANIVVSFLHNFVPGILVSISDAVAGIVVAIIGIILGIIMILGAIISIVFALKP